MTENELIQILTEQNEQFKNMKGMSFCPRCLNNRLSTDIGLNCISRHIKGILICDDCGSDESIRQLTNNVLPTYSWAYFVEEY